MQWALPAKSGKEDSSIEKETKPSRTGKIVGEGEALS